MNIYEFNGYLMSKDICLAKIENGLFTDVYKPNLMPFYIVRTNNLEGWLKKRAIDAHRTNSRLLKKALRLAERDDVATVLSVNAATITDTYWIKGDDAHLTWEDVRFKDDYFANLALRGDLSAYSNTVGPSPELTNVGSFEKCWKLENNEWWIHKKANKYELFSELFIYYLGRELGFPMAHYEKMDNSIRSLDFTGHASVNFEAAFGWMDENEDYVDNYKWLNALNPDFADRYVEILLMDAFCRNGDRHTGNYGVFRDVDTGEVIGFAPNYDNNIALVYTGDLSMKRKPDLLGELLHDLERDTKAITKYLDRNKLPIITDDMIDKCIDQTGIDIDREYIKDFVKVGYEQTPLSAFRIRSLSERMEQTKEQYKSSRTEKNITQERKKSPGMHL